MDKAEKRELLREFGEPVNLPTRVLVLPFSWTYKGLCSLVWQIQKLAKTH